MAGKVALIVVSRIVMSLITMISIAMVLLGVGLMSASINGGFRLNSRLPDELRRRWQLLTGLMVFFDLAYVIFVFHLLTGLNFPIELLVGTILLGGAVFVFMFIKLTEITVVRMKVLQHDDAEINRLLSESNRDLAEQVRERDEISAELRESKTELENVFNNSIPLCITNNEHDILRVNDAYHHIFGKPPEGVVTTRVLGSTPCINSNFLRLSEPFLSCLLSMSNKVRFDFFIATQK